MDYDAEYFFIEKAESESLPVLTPDEKTEDRTFRFEAQPVGSAPLVFFNGAKDLQRRRRITPPKTPPDILFSGSNLVVRTRIRESLLHEDIYSLSMHPAIYIDERERWHEDYWYMTFTETLDCWDRKSSDFKSTPLIVGGEALYSVYSYSLDGDILDKAPVERKRLFKMGGTQDGHITCHSSMTKHFMPALNVGIKFTKIADY